MRIKFTLAALSVAVFASIAQAAATPVKAPAAPPSSPASAATAQGPQATQVATSVGFAMGAMPELQRVCKHTAEQKRRVSRVIAYLELQMTKGGGAPVAAAFKQGLAGGARQVSELTRTATAEQLKEVCTQMSTEFDPKLVDAEKGIPESFMPDSQVSPAKGSASKTAGETKK